MKYFKSIFITLSILLSITNLSFALDVCPGEIKTLSWSSSNANTCVPQNTGNSKCNFDPSPNVASTSVVTVNASTTSGNFCTVTLTCTNAANVQAVSTDSLHVKTLGQCQNAGTINPANGTAIWCPAGQVPNYTNPGSIYAGNGCIATTATVVGGSCTIPENASSCMNALSWSTNDTNLPLVTNANTGATISTLPSGSSIIYSTPYGGAKINISNNGTILNSVQLGASCAAGTAWDTEDNLCRKSDATIDLTATNCEIA